MPPFQRNLYRLGLVAVIAADAVGPSLAVIGVGAENPYGHPAQKIMDRLARAVAVGRLLDADIVVRGVVEKFGMRRITIRHAISDNS